jgi:hypothetical protein
MLVVLMTNGSYLLVGYPQAGPTALVIQDDAGPLRQALEAAFGPGHLTEEGASGNTTGSNKSKRNGTVAHGSGPIRTTQAQP